MSGVSETSKKRLERVKIGRNMKKLYRKEMYRGTDYIETV